MDTVGARVTVLPPREEPLLRLMELGARVTPDKVFITPPDTTRGIIIKKKVQ